MFRGHAMTGLRVLLGFLQILNVLPQAPHLIRPCLATLTPTKVCRQYGQVIVGTEGAIVESLP